jgi:DNA transposition AAA+ family ATPase
MRDLIAETSNVRRLSNATHALLYRSHGTAGIGLVWGPVGLGKTTATQHVCLMEEAVWVTAHPDWSPAWMFGDIAVELGATRSRITRENFANAVGALRERPRAIFIDEADWLPTGRPHLQKVEGLRALHDATQAPLILIGMSQLPRAIKALPQLESRVAHWLEFTPCDLRDVRTMAETLCEIELSDDLIREIHRATAGSARAIRLGLERLENLARRRAKRKLQFADLPEDFTLIPSARPSRRDDPRREEPRASESANNVVALRSSEGANA